MTKVRIKLSGERSEDLDNVVSQLKELCTLLTMKFIGPIRLPRRRLRITTRRSPCGDGSGTFEYWEKRISKRLIDIEGDDKYINQILKVKVPTNVFVRISLTN